MNNSLRFFVLGIAMINIAYASDGNYKPDAGYIQDESVARAIGLAVLESIYGKETIAKQRPLFVELKNGIWYIQGNIPDGWLGGVAEIELRKDNGEILRVFHHQ